MTPQTKNNDDKTTKKHKSECHVAKKNKIININIITLVITLDSVRDRSGNPLPFSGKDWERIARPVGNAQKKKNINLKKTTMPILETAVGAAGGLLGGAINAISQSKANRQNRHFTREMFDKTNLYNSPIEQVKRLKAAGLNPAQMYGSGSSASISSSSASQPSTPENRPYQIPEALFADIAQKLASAQLANANADATNALNPLKQKNLAADTNLKITQTEASKQAAINAAIIGQKIQQEYNLDRVLFDSNVQYRKEQLKKLNQDVQEQKIQLNYLDQNQQTQLESLKQDLALKMKQNKTLDLQNWVLENDQKLREMYINPNGTNMADTILRYLVGNAKSFINGDIVKKLH